MIMIKEKRMWDYLEVMEMCVAEKLYTCGNDQEYTKMLRFVSHAEPTNENMVWVADDILKHSDTERNIEEMMFLLNKRCVNTFYTITDPEDLDDFICKDYEEFDAMEKMLDSIKE